jgi:hypothetical protein
LNPPQLSQGLTDSLVEAIASVFVAKRKPHAAAIINAGRCFAIPGVR